VELRFTDHPVWKKPLSDEEMEWLLENDPALLQKLWEAHEGRIKAAEDDPLNHGVELEHWGYAEERLETSLSVMALGGNRSGKTEWGARCVVRRYCSISTHSLLPTALSLRVWNWGVRSRRGIM
jgi:hypothetical protein